MGNGYALGHTHGLYYGHYLGKRSADAEPGAKPYIVGHYPYGNGYALGHGVYYGGLYGHYLGKRSADAKSEAKPESNPYYGYGGYGYGLGYGGYGLGYGGYGLGYTPTSAKDLLTASPEQSLILLGTTHMETDML